jgi:uncharacterized membrane protein
MPNIVLRNSFVFAVFVLMIVLISACVEVAPILNEAQVTPARITPETVDTIVSATRTPTKIIENNPSSTATQTVPPEGGSSTQKQAGPSYFADVRPMFMGRCTECHGYEPGRFDPHTYDGLLGVVIPGNPESSTFIQMMSYGHHAPGLKPRELEVVREWILAGAKDN